MAFREFAFSENVSIDRFEEGSLIVDEGAQTVICLGKFETSLLDLLMEKGVAETVSTLMSQYEDKRINTDVNDFCNDLIRRHIIIRQ